MNYFWLILFIFLNLLLLVFFRFKIYGFIIISNIILLIILIGKYMLIVVIYCNFYIRNKILLRIEENLIIIRGIGINNSYDNINNCGNNN